MASRTTFECIRCGATYGADQDWFGCPACAATSPANLRLVSPAAAALSPELARAWEQRPPGVWRFVEALPVAADQAISLGEGGTPLLELAHIGPALGLPRLLAKNEGQNPTWSFKDRLASVAVSWGRANGRRGIAVSSSGNAGASAAAYAARAGLPCIIFTTRGFPGTMQRFMRAYGAMVVAVPEAADRWTLNRAVAERWHWLPLSNVADPPVGSHPAGVAGHTTLAFELALDLDWEPPDAVIVPVAYGDALAGLYRGFLLLRDAGLIDRLPRLIAAETYPSLTDALATGSGAPLRVEGHGSQAFSVATRQSTYQALQAIRGTDGSAVVVPDDETRRWQAALREREGLFVELSSAMPVAAAARLYREGLLSPADRVVALLTSSGLKDPEITLPEEELPLVEPKLAALERLLAERYGYAA